MKKVIGFVALGLVLCSAAWAFEVDSPVDITGKGAIPRPVDRTGSCVVTSVDDTANTISVWGTTTWFLGDAHAIYIDPATDQDAAGGCSAPFYPFHVTSLDFLFVELTDDTNQVGQTVTYAIEFVCPRDLATGSVSGDECHGPGSVFASYTLAYTLARTDFDENGVGGFINVNLPTDVCVDRGFFVVARFTGWTGVGQAPQIVWHRQRAEGGPTDRCDNWLWLGTALAADCWLLTGYEIGYGCGTDTPPPGFAACFPGSAFVFANGDAGVVCTPSSFCPAAANNYPGDDASDPINVNTSPWLATIDLCQYTSDYNYYYDADAAPVTNRRWTGRNEDVVLDLNYSQNPVEACFTVVITPVCPPRRFFQLRSWIDDSFGFPLWWGSPQYPGSGAAQTYNFTATGLQCQFPDRYLLYIDGRGGCCCPVNVSVTGDQPLPVELVSLGATAGDGFVRLNWVTRSESGIESYAIVRNGDEIATVDGMGDSPTGHTYSFVDNNVENGTPYTYRLVAYGVDGTMYAFTQSTEATPSATPVVTDYALLQNYPNPFNPGTSITYSVKETGHVKLTVYSIDGREVVTLVDGAQDANVYTVQFNGSSFANGVYLYTLEVNGFSDTKKMVLMK